MKKAQTHQVFFYIMVIIVVGAVVLIGYSAIGDILKKQCDISKITFKDDMKEKLDSNRNYGYSENKEIKVPCNVETICFLNETLTNNQISKIKNIQMKTAAQVNSEDNIFILTNGKTEPLLQMEKIRVDKDEGYICIESRSGRFPIKMESAGYGYVKVSQGS